MNEDNPKQERRLHQKLVLAQTARSTEMGTLLRKFWHPVALSHELKNGTAKPLRVLGEDLTLYRGASGRPYLVGGRCAHRLTLLHTGWVEAEAIRCVYHGWKYDGTGQCIERPAEKDSSIPDVKVEGYPLHEYCGLIFAFLGAGPAPEFDLPRKELFEQNDIVVFPRIQVWDCNWFQQIENSLDAVHVSFVHQLGLPGAFGAAVTADIPELSYKETESGIEQVATRSKDNVRKSDWTFPNNNHIVIPGIATSDPWIHINAWMVPIDDKNTMRVALYCSPRTGADAERFLQHFEKRDYNPADHRDELFNEGKFPQDPTVELIGAQDYIAQIGQGAIAERANELLGRSDLGIMYMRRIFWRELEAIRTGSPTKRWRRLAAPAEMPTQPGLLESAQP